MYFSNLLGMVKDIIEYKAQRRRVSSTASAGAFDAALDAAEPGNEGWLP
jgi:hypothetical protein